MYLLVSFPAQSLSRVLRADAQSRPSAHLSFVWRQNNNICYFKLAEISL